MNCKCTNLRKDEIEDRIMPVIPRNKRGFPRHVRYLSLDAEGQAGPGEIGPGRHAQPGEEIGGKQRLQVPFICHGRVHLHAHRNTPHNMACLGLRTAHPTQPGREKNLALRRLTPWLPAIISINIWKLYINTITL